MNTNNYLSPFSPQRGRPQAASTATKFGLACLSGCGLLVVLIIVFGFLSFRKGTTSLAEGDVVARQFLGYVQANQPEQAYALTHSGWKQRSSLAELKTWMGVWRARTGAFQSITSKGQWWFTGTGGTQVTLVYYLQGTKSLQQVSIRLMKESDRLKLTYCDFTDRPSIDSPIKDRRQAMTEQGTVGRLWLATRIQRFGVRFYRNSRQGDCRLKATVPLSSCIGFGFQAECRLLSPLSVIPARISGCGAGGADS